MKEYTQDEIKTIYEIRRSRISLQLFKNDIGAAVFIDSEEHRDPTVRYLTGHNGDAIVILFSDSFTYLIAWDENLAKKNAFYDKLVPYTRYKNKDIDAVKAILNVGYTHGVNSKVELPPYLTYPHYLRFLDALNNYDCRCKEEGIHKYALECRIEKDDYEIECIREAARIGDLIVDKIEEKIKDGSIKTEADAALFIERECREHGCEGTGFDTLAAGPSRSFAIHAFPNYTNAPWPAKGLSILDFGVVYNGYTSDQTITIAKGRLSQDQKKQLELVQKAYNECLKLYTPKYTVQEAAKRADYIFAQSKRKMPHTLGHGIGLEIHEYPRVSTKMPAELKFKPGMVLTLEPGLYDETLGGCRLENDVLITEKGNEVITHSRIIYIN